MAYWWSERKVIHVTQQQIKLVAIDLDGTLLTDDKQLPQANIDAIHQAIQAGVQVVICTGRTLPGVRDIIAQLPFDGEDDFLILQNGSVTHRLHNLEIMDQVTLSAQARASLMAFARVFDEEGAQLVAFDQEGMMLVSQYEASEIVISDSKALSTPITLFSAEEFLAYEGFNKAMVLAEPAVLDGLKDRVPSELSAHFSTVRSQPIIAEFLVKGVSKASGLKTLAQRLGFEAQEVMAIGDQLNDLEMLEWAGLGVAMGNAVAGIKEVADVVTGTNEEAGVAQAIERHILSEGKA